MASYSTLRNGAEQNRATSTSIHPYPDVTPVHEFLGPARLYLVERSLLEQANPFSRRTYALRSDYVRPASLQEAHEQGTMLPTDGAAVVIGVTSATLKKSRQRGRGPSYYRYGRRGPIVYSLTEVLSFKAHLVTAPNRELVQDALAYAPADKFFTRRGAALILGVSVSLLKRWRRADVGPHYFQFGFKGRILYKLNDLNAFKAESLVVTKKDGHQ